MLLRLGIASTSLDSLSQIRLQTHLSFHQVARILNLYPTHLSAWIRVLDSQLPGHTTVAGISNALSAAYPEMAGQDSKCGHYVENRIMQKISDIIGSRRLSLFGHVARLGEQTPAHCALKTAIDVRSGSPPSSSWRRPRGRPRDTWLTPCSFKLAWSSIISGSMLVLLVMALQRNVPSWTCEHDDGNGCWGSVRPPACIAFWGAI